MSLYNYASWESQGHRKTLEKLANGLRDATKYRSATSGTQCEAWAAENMGLDPPSIDPRLADTVDHAMARAQSPLDPFVSTVPSPSPAPQRNLEAAARPPRHSMTRSSVQTMAGSFPTGSERTIADPMPQADFSTGRNVHNPLLFLAECARRGWDSADGAETRTASTTAPAPSTTLPLEDAIRLGRWSSEKLSQIIADQRKYFQHGLHGIKRDVSIALDPVYQNVVKEDQVVTLFDNYFRHVHCQWAILDRDVHTPTYVRSRSAFLFTVVLALGATSIATLSASTIHDSTLAIKLWGHLEKLQLVVCATAAKSIEIVQGVLLAQMWALRTPRLVDDQRATRLGITVRMANQIGLQLSKSRGTCPGDQRNMNDFKARLSLVLVESRWESIADRQDISCPGFDLTEVEAEDLDRTGPFDDNAILAADYALYRFEAESKERISRVPPNARMATAMDSERVWIQTYLSSWDRKWVDPQPDPLRRWWFRYLSIRSRLVGILRVAKARTQAGPWTNHMRADLLLVSTELLEGCLSHERAMHMLRPTSPIVFAAAILLQLTKKDAPERDLILRVALRLAGEPKQGDIMTYAVHNGYQILNMLCLSKEVARTAGGSMAGNPNYTQASVPPLAQHEEHVQQQQHQQQPQQRQQQDHIPTANQRADSPSITTYQLYEDIDQLLGLEPGFTGTGIAHLGQWQGGVAHSEHSTNTMWSDFLSTEPMSAEGSGIETQSVEEIPGSGYSAWPVNVVEDPLNLVVGDGQMTDNDISDFYFHLASALGG
ncbi:hypothetical protein I316_06525 [Kwoniella heveanensis BCC8398]|uniref:Xylanolytic transcriptional activator regulatory domain-containing protein n=1 Tax=Kwoniella heveanensis BCC8398 TaxID=1296120 RepID=A0A1B9GL57_9TREE|nr:hypothetical protein I316_06525 [Kwoniella heveanensis BCC8398]